MRDQQLYGLKAKKLKTTEERMAGIRKCTAPPPKKTTAVAGRNNENRGQRNS